MISILHGDYRWEFNARQSASLPPLPPNRAPWRHPTSHALACPVPGMPNLIIWDSFRTMPEGLEATDHTNGPATKSAGCFINPFASLPSPRPSQP